MIQLAPNAFWVLLLAAAAAGAMWLLYRRGSPQLRRPYVWLLPLLRSTAVFLLVFTLAEPMLRRNVEHEILSKLRFVVDESTSMRVTDAELPVDEKVEIAIAHGWLDEAGGDLKPLEEAWRVQKIRKALVDATRSNASLDQAREATAKLAEAEFGELSAAAKALLREDWIPSVARRRQIEIGEFVRELAELESGFRSEFAAEFDGETARFDRSTRLERVRNLLKSAEKLKGDHEVSVEALGQDGGMTDLTAIAPPGRNPGQSETIILLSDGRHHADSSEPGDVAALWRNAGAQLFTVGLGSTVPRPDLILTNTHQPRRIAPGDLISGAIEIYDSMPSGQQLLVEIVDENSGEVLWSDEVETLGEGLRVLSFAFQTPDDDRELPVLLNFVARVSDLDGEARDDNNSMPMPVFLTSPPQSSMLVIDGRPRWDSRYLRNIFSRDPSWTTDANFAPHQNVLPDEETLKSYDLIVIGEVPSSVVSDQHLVWLEEHVRAGTGLILIDGSREELRDLFGGDNPLSPVSWIDAPQWLDRPHLALTAEGAREPALTLAPNKADNEAIWSYLPAPHRAIRTRPKAGATVLAEARSESGNTPMLVTQSIGYGRVLYISSDESWRWRYQKGDEYHTRYWQQIARWIMAEPFLVRTDEAEFDLDRLRIRRGESAMIRVRFQEPRTEFEAVVTLDGAEILRTTDLIENLEPGRYEVQLAGVEGTAIPFRVIEPISMEETVTHADPQLLREMAERGGGEFVGEAEFPDLLKILEGKKAVVTTTDSISIWQSFGWLGLIVALVAAELFLRKRAGLL